MEELRNEFSKNSELNGLKKNNLPIKVMVVDDAMFIRRSMTKILSSVGYEVIGEAENGLEAVEKYIELRPDVVTMDITMPIMEGTEAVVKMLEKDNTAKIVMVSAMGYQSIVKEAILSGAKNFIVKPIKPDNLKRVLKILKNVVVG